MPETLTVQQIKRITKGTLVQRGAPAVITGISIDSRAVKKGNAFVAIKGQRFNGHDFLREAIRKGAVAVIISEKTVGLKNAAVIYVKDTTRALGQIAAWHRRQFDIPVIAVTGSAGKTTTKEIIGAVLGTRYKVLKNVKTENNHYGVPLTLLRLNASHEIAVLELGTNRPGDIRWLAQMVRPTTVVFTNIGETHLEGLKNRMGVFREKVQLIKYMEAGGSIILNGDDCCLMTMLKKRRGQRLIRFGCSQNADCTANGITARNNRRTRFKVGKAVFTIRSAVIHNVYNALAAISCGRLYRIRYNKISSALSRFKFPDARQEITRIGRVWLIDDTYNANPLSLKSAIRTLNTLKIKGKRIAVCADMLELGPQSAALHESAGRMIAQSATDVVLTTGRYARYITRGLNRFNGNIRAVHCGDVGEVNRRLKALCSPGDAVLVKGSRGMRMERTVRFLKDTLQ